MAQQPLRVGLIGYGFASQTFHVPLIGAEAGLQLVAVSSSQPDKVHAQSPAVEVESDPLVLCQRADLDLVVIASPNDTHAPLARAALLAGKHVVIDKPFTVTLDEARGLIALAEQQQRLLSVFHNRRWDSDYLSVRAAIEQDQLGRITHFESHIDRFRPHVRQRWREQAGAGAGLWFDLGPHLVDQALQLFGLPQRVLASLAIARDGASTDDWAHVVLEYERLRVIVHASMLVAGGSPRFTVHGERGSLLKHKADGQEAQLKEGMRPGAPGWGEDDDAPLLFDGDGNSHKLATVAGDQRQYYAGIVKALRGEAPNPVPAIQALAVMAVIEAGIEANASGHARTLALSEHERAAWRASIEA